VMDISDISQGSSGGNRRRTFKSISSSQISSNNNNNNNNKLRVRFSSVAKGPLLLGIRVFANKEFVSLDLNDRKQVWYSGLEIRAMKQASMDHVAAGKNKEGQSSANEKDDEEDWRGLEHIVEGETKRRQRIHYFVRSTLKIQSERQRKGSKPEAIADALGAFSRSQSRSDRRRAHKAGKLDYADAHHILQQDQGGVLDLSCNNSTHSLRRSLFKRSSSTKSNSSSSSHHRRVSDCVKPSHAALRRSRSEDNESLGGKRHALRRMSSRVRAVAMLPHKRLSTTSIFSSASMQSTGSTASVTSSG
jgi:hypothetical protein